MDFKVMLKKYGWILGECLYLLLVLGYLFYIDSNYAMPTLMSGDLFKCVLLFFTAITILFGEKINKVTTYIALMIYSLYFITQQIYNRGFGQYYRFATAISLKDEVIGASSSAMELVRFSDFVPLIILTIITIVFSYVSFKFYPKQEKKFLRIGIRILIVVCLILPISSLYGSYINKIEQTKEGVDIFSIYQTDYYVYTSIPNTVQFVDKFSLLGFLIRDTESFLEQDLLGNDEIENIDNYFMNKKAPEINDLTGVFEGKSLFFIQAESLMNLGINEYLTPTLYKMMQEGIAVKNFCTPLLAASTSDTEFMINTALIPVSDGYAVSNLYLNNTYPSTLGNSFKDQGYNVYGFHNNYAEYYSRNVMFPNYGYDFFDSYRMGLENLASDSDVLEIMKWMLLEKDKFLAFWVTFNGHQPYDLESQNEDIRQYFPVVKDAYPNLEEDLVCYMAKNMDLDKALEEFMIDANNNGKLADIVFIIMGDHYAKGIAGSNPKERYVNENGLVYDIDSYYTPLIIYNSEFGKVEIEKSGTALDLYPTIMNMWNIEYDYKTTLGNDIFDKDYHGFYFGEAGIYRTDDFEYDYIEDKYTLKNGVSLEQAKEDVYNFIEKKEISKNILKLDYFSHRKESSND